MTIFGIVMLSLLSLVNLSHILWTYWLTVEQIKTGWGFGTSIELAVLYPWLTELFCAPVLLAAAVYLILSCFKEQRKSILIANCILFAAAIAQYLLTNLFIWY